MHILQAHLQVTPLEPQGQAKQGEFIKAVVQCKGGCWKTIELECHSAQSKNDIKMLL